MSKRNKIIYWIATIWMSLGMTSSAIVQLIRMQEETDMFTHLGYPLYLLTFIGIAKLIGVVIVLAPKLPLLKEWAYAGFFFIMAGALFSHIVMGDAFGETFPPVLLLLLIGTSWYFRPEGRKLVSVNSNTPA